MWDFKNRIECKYKSTFLAKPVDSLESALRGRIRKARCSIGFDVGEDEEIETVNGDG